MIFANHLKSQSRVVLNQIYQDSPSSCLAVFRMLQYGSQLILMRLLTAPHELSISSVLLRSWFMSTPQGRLQYEQLLEQLKSLAILLPGTGSDVDDHHDDVMGMDGMDGDLNADEVYTVNEQFKLGLTQTLLGTAERGSFGMQCQSIDLTKKASMLSPAQLEYYASTKWEGILHFMVGSGQQLKTVTPSQNVLQLLLDSGLMQVLDGDQDRKRKSSIRAATSDMHITNLGFQFLLQDIVTQVQSILLYYADAVQKLNGNIVRVQVEVFQMIFMLGQLQVGRPYEININQQSRYTETQITLLDDLSELGLVRIVQSDSNLLVFTPTQLCSAINASTSSSAVSSSSSLQIVNKFNNTQVHQQDSFIIVETNFRVYAYTDSPLKISIISLFTQINAKFPNFVVGQVTRDSVRRALRNGITAKLICQFLQSHAHPIVVKAQQQQQYGMSHQSNVPPSVIDQICLWEIERNRLALKDGFLYRDFSVEEEWEATLKYAQDLNILLWTSTPSTMPSQQSSSSSSFTGLSLPVNKRQLVVSAEGHQLLKEFVKDWSIQQKNQ